MPAKGALCEHEEQGATQCHAEHLCESQDRSPQCSEFPTVE